MAYLLVFAALVIVARIAGPLAEHRDIEREMRETEYQHRVSVYGDPE